MGAAPAVIAVAPPGAEELARQREVWEREWKRRQRDGSKGKEEADDKPVTLTREEIQTATMLGRQWSAENSGHGRAAHGGYASSSSAYTAENNRVRSEQEAIEREIANALQRKRKTGSAFNK